MALVAAFLAAPSCKRHTAPLESKADWAPPTRPTAAPSPSSIPLAPVGRTEDERNTIAVFHRDAPSAVFVSQQRMVYNYFQGRAFDVPAGSGSGFIWDTDGHIVTNFHVIEGARKVTVTLGDQHTFDATIVGTEPRRDIAVLHIDAPNEKLHPIPHTAKPPALEVGEKVLAIGNPFGLDNTLTAGIVSALGRQVEGVGGVTIRDMIQTDAAINPGNSGGPLLNSSGELIGMNTMILSKSGGWAGIGFAVPAEFILRIVPQIIKTGHAEQVGIGVRIDPQRRIAQRLGLRGVIVLQVIPGSPAAKAGIEGISRTPTGFQLGDVIVGFDGKRVTDYDDLYNMLDGRKVGENAKVQLMRNGQVRTVEIPLVEVQ
jgi:S1-C subfamily serine protease